MTIQFPFRSQWVNKQIFNIWVKSRMVSVEEKQLPVRLKEDAILEALIEIRFQSEDLPEVVLGRLSDNEMWRGYKRVRNPVADIPAPIRDGDANLKYAPVFEYVSPSGQDIFKFNHNMLSFHNARKYYGWLEFSKHVFLVLESLFDRLDGVIVNRLGLRYINCLDNRHFIHSVNDLNIDVLVKGKALETDFNVNYLDQSHQDCNSMVRIASPNFIEGKIPQNAIAFFDIDVFSKRGKVFKDKQDCINWIENSHAKEKELFFGLMPENVVEKLKAE